MGQTLTEPVVTKESFSDENDTLKVGSSCMQGWRVYMEDYSIQKFCLNDDKDMHLFSVFDGHGGDTCAAYAKKQLGSLLAQQPSLGKGLISKSLRSAYLLLDEKLRTECSNLSDSSGCTAVSTIIKDNKIYCANIGDSRAVASVRGHAQLLSFDHKPNHERERNRIENAGGFVENCRVNGSLAPSRAFGDFVYKQNTELGAKDQIVTANPDILIKEITDEHEFIVLASDGVWDVMGNQDVVEFVRKNLAKKVEPVTICEQMINCCLSDNNFGPGSDNMTVVIIALKNNKSFEELCKKCAIPRSCTIPSCCLLDSYPNFVLGGISVL